MFLRMKKKTRRIFLFLAGSVIAVVAGAVVSGYLMLVMSVPIIDGRLQVAGPENDIEITFDSLGIAQIWAESDHDCYFGLGYQHAADRMFQMDLIRRLSQGRLSEALGELSLEWDISQRRIGHSRLAQRALPGLDSASRARLQAYCDGVNAYAKYCRAMPFEFRLLPIDFETWTVYDCLTVFSYQTWFSNALMNTDEWRRDLFERVGPERAADFVEGYPDWAPVTIPFGNEALFSSDQIIYGGATNRGAAKDVCLELVLSGGASDVHEPTASMVQKAIAQSLFEHDSHPLRMATASNVWVIGPDKSASGQTMLAADPHLEVSRLPQFWYYVGLHSQQLGTNILGITTPGIPFVVMGHNGQAAWAFTVAGIDVSDYFREQIDPADSSSYLDHDGSQPFEIITDTIIVSGRDEPVIVTFRATSRGIVVDESASSGEVYSLRWAGEDVDLSQAVSAGFDLGAISTFEEFQHAVTRLGALDASWMYADNAGNIGYQLGTSVAIRDSYAAAFPRSVGNGTADNHEYLRFDQLPHAYNPDQGWLACCNNLPTRDQDLPGHYAFDRITRIDQLIRSYGKLSSQDMGVFQMDLHDAYRLRWRDTLAAALYELGHDGSAMWVGEWRGKCDSNSTVPGLMLLFLSELKKRLFADELGNLAAGLPAETFERFFEEMPDDSLRHVIILESAASASELADERAWGQMQTLTMRHPLAVVPVLGDMLELSQGPWPWSGTPGTPNASFATADSEGSFRTIVGASWRFVIDFADVDAATIVLPGGNSGNPMSEHFFDFFERYRTGGRWTVPIHYDKVKARAASVLVLEPEQ